MSYVENHMKHSLTDHILVPYCDQPNLKAWYLKDPQLNRMMSSLILFTEEGIVIQGDLTPGIHGAISAFGYGVNWFSKKLSESYLCEKFLRKVFVPELAVRQFKGQVNEALSEGRFSASKAEEALIEIDNYADELNGYLFYEIYGRYFDDSPEIGFGYDPADAGWLCAIQQKFSELYHTTHDTTPG